MTVQHWGDHYWLLQDLVRVIVNGSFGNKGASGFWVYTACIYKGPVHGSGYIWPDMMKQQRLELHPQHLMGGTAMLPLQIMISFVYDSITSNWQIPEVELANQMHLSIREPLAPNSVNHSYSSFQHPAAANRRVRAIWKGKRYPRVRSRKMSFCGSDDILRKLPKPYDISSAVSRALRIDSSNRTEVTWPASEWPSNSMTRIDGTDASKRLDPRSMLFSSTYCEDYLEDIQLDMEVEVWSEAGASEGDILDSEKNIHQLEKFCKFIDSSGEEDLEYLPDGYCHDQRPYSFSEFSITPRSRQPPRKKRRRTVGYDSSPDASPEKPQAQSEMKYDWNVRLANGDLWKQFDSIGTEMVITKNGR